jgi:hypothetical protein
VAIRNGRDRVQLVLDRRRALGFDGGLVHERGVVIADLPKIGAFGGNGFGRVFDQRPGARPGQVHEDGANTVTRLVGGNGGGFQPSAVGIRVEIIARRDGFVHTGNIDSRSRPRGSFPARGRGGGGNREQNGSERTA